MKRISVPGIPFLFFSSLALLTACAPATKFMRDPSVAKCYVAEDSKHITAEEHKAIFQAVETEGHAFPSCDSASPETMRIRPRNSRVPTQVMSYLAIGVDLTTLSLGVSQAFAQQKPSWLLFSLLQVYPTAHIFYRAEYKDSKGKKQQENFLVTVPAWFKDRVDSKSLLLEQASRDLSSELFGKEYLKKPLPERSARLSIDIPPLILSSRLGGIPIEAHYEKFFPKNLALDVSPAVFLPFSKPEYIYWLYAGPRKYFSPDHTGYFIGLEPYIQGDYRYGEWYAVAALPITFGAVGYFGNGEHGFLWGGKGNRFVMGWDIGIGPAVSLRGHYERNYVLFGSIYTGIAF